MGINSFITDGNGSRNVAHVSSMVNGTRDERGLLVQTEPYRIFDTVFHPFLNDTYGNSMNQNAGFTGTPVLIHDGTDSVAWTGSNIVGTRVTFDSTTQAVSPTKSVYVNSPNLNDTWEFDRGSNLDLTSYSSISMQVYVEGRWTVGDSISIYGWDTTTGTKVGGTVLLEDYINEFDFGSWQPVVISLSDILLENETIDALRFELTGKSGQAPQFYIDDMQVEEAGGSLVFKANADPGTIFFNTGFLFTLAFPLNISLTNGTVPGLSYDKFMQLSQLANGITIVRVQEAVTKFSFTIRDLGTWLGSGTELTNVICDGTNTYLGIISSLPQPVILTGDKDENFISVVINDDLSGLLRFTGLALGYEELPRGKTVGA